MLIKFTLIITLINFKFANTIVTSRSGGDFVDFILSHSDSSTDQFLHSNNKCTSKLYGSLEKLRKRQANLKSTGFIDLSGYALHQTLRHLPLDMYVTDILVRTPRVGDWVRIEKCQFSNRENRMTAKILFNDLTVSGTVQLIDDAETLKSSYHSVPREFCKMSLRFQRAGLGINAFPTKARSRRLDVRTEARFLDPKFLSVHAYGCKLSDIFKKRDNFNGENLEAFTKDESDHPTAIEDYRKSKAHYVINNSNQDTFRNETNHYFDTPLYTRIDSLARSLPSEDHEKISYPFSHSIDNASKILSFRERENKPGIDFYKEKENLERDLPLEDDEEKPEVTIITLNPDMRTNDDLKWFSLHKEQEADLNDYHRHRILGTRKSEFSEKDKLKAILHVQNLIAQQANHVFQTQGPFSNGQKLIFKPLKQFKPKPKPKPSMGHSVISTITELDENLSPIRPIPQKPFEVLLSQNTPNLNKPGSLDFQNYYEVISREMEDIFLRGIKTLLTRYVEKQLELPLKEALMVNIGYTVSYG